jgi:hypothetical protein
LQGQSGKQTVGLSEQPRFSPFKKVEGCKILLNKVSEINQMDKVTVNPYVVYVLCDYLPQGFGEALIDTGSQVSLVKRDSLTHAKIRPENISFQTVTGELFPVIGVVELCINNVRHGKKMPFYVVKSLPQDVDMLLGQDWLELHDSEIRIPWKQALVKVPPFSETVVQFATTEQGIRHCQKQVLGRNLICADSIVQCDQGRYCCLIINWNEEEMLIEKVPELTTISLKENTNLANTVNRNELLLGKLRTSHITEGLDELKELCLRYNDIFRLPGDRLTATKTVVHSIPTPSVMPGRAITLKNYRIPEQHQEEVNRQVDEMLKQGIITPSKSPWNFLILVVPKKIDASGVRKWRICKIFGNSMRLR